jgi:hypothetical protein
MYNSNDLPKKTVVGWGTCPSSKDADTLVGYVDMMIGDHGPIRVTMPLDRYVKAILPQVEAS